jgi:sec-independent protein translocase protein TatA
MHTLAGLLGPIGTPELIIIALVGLLIFGRRLPEVGRGLGRSIVEFRKGLRGVEDEIDTAGSKPQIPGRETVSRAPLTAAGEDPRVSRPAYQQPAADAGGGQGV